MNKLGLSLSSALLGLSFSAPAAPIVELFTSQGCYSCPPADEHLADIIKNNPEVVALEYHVDYWDQLVYGSAGVWKDPFSDPAYTVRQRLYNQNDLAGRRGVYTPQMIVNGSTAQVGTSRKAVRKALGKAPPDVNISAAYADNSVSVNIEGREGEESILWLAIFDRLHVTDVPTGENHGKTMVNHHVVRELVPLGRWGGDTVSASFPIAANMHSPGGEGSGCAVLLQDEDHGPILGAGYCN